MGRNRKLRARRGSSSGSENRQDQPRTRSPTSCSDDGEYGDAQQEPQAFAYARQKGPLPASDTKHLDLLPYPLPALDVTLLLKQRSAASTEYEASTGTTLWLSSQILVCYLIANKVKLARSNRRESRDAPRAIELGSGTGMLALVLTRLGFETLATDIEPALCQVLRPNLSDNAEALALAAAAANPKGDGNAFMTPRSACLDWTECPATSDAGTAKAERSHSTRHDVAQLCAARWAAQLCKDAQVPPPWSLILSTDTLYHPPLIAPFWSTVKALVLASRAAAHHNVDSHDPSAPRPGAAAADKQSKGCDPVVLIALERRDSSLIDEALQVGRHHGFDLKQVSQRTLRKAVDAHLGAHWERGAWEGVEVWSCVLQ
ncbi:S-ADENOSYLMETHIONINE-DEPENDENT METHYLTRANSFERASE DOMAIN-CONTAINING PROTEIN [Ceraceosorus bombacis]|uniref:S-ADENOSYLMETHIONINE-DEPENDENT METHYLTRANSFERASE DOMAIN-CONTAINING PROTEIN n=1 Tax=Ceraceosorus bombacis TaxID=401625 RepID=A0A0N7L8S2_9BASI|nr:S-ADENOSYLMETHIONINE-DEPENDENT METHYLTRANSFERASE DOMAIN-CONTAINING PROTEIN [Ceraceosorus bombacis]